MEPIVRHVAYTDLPWRDEARPGMSRADIAGDASGARMTFWDVRAGARFPRHGHAGFEYICLVRGAMEFSGRVLHEGDVLPTAAGEEHEAVALRDSVLLVFKDPAQASSGTGVEAAAGRKTGLRRASTGPTARR